MNLIQFIEEQKAPLGFNKPAFLNEAWEKIDSVIKDDRILFFENYENAKKQVAFFENNLLNNKFNFENPKKDYIKIIGYYCALQFFPTNDTLNIFRNLGFSKSDLKFFIPILSIAQEIENVNKSANVRLKFNTVMQLLKVHFEYKIIDIVQKHFDLVSKKKSGSIYNEAHNKLFDFFRNYSNYQKNNSKFLDNDKNLLFLEILNQSKDITSTEAHFRKELLDNAQGKTEKNILKSIFDLGTYYKCSEGELYRTVFNFFKLIMPDSSLLTEDEFYGSDQSVSYDGSYSRYQYLKLKSILKTSVK